MKRDYTVIDVETTGLDSVKDRIIQIGAIRYRNLVEVDRFEVKVEVGRPIPEIITKITGITDEDMVGAYTQKEGIKKMLEFVGSDRLVAHNAEFDKGFLEKTLERELGESLENQFECTLILSRVRVAGVKNHKLETLKKYLGLDVGSHNALDDCYVTGELYKYIYKKWYEEEDFELELDLG